MDKFMPGVGPLNQPNTNFHPMPEISRHEGTLFFAVNEHSRVSIATSIERLIDLLDAMEDDPDEEDGGDEEWSLGWTESQSAVGAVACHHFHDCEQDTADLEDGGDREPNLGATERPVPYGWAPGRLGDGDQSDWGEFAPTTAAMEERELENEHGGDVVDQPHDGNCDDEPPLGWATQEGQHGVGMQGWNSHDDENPATTFGMLQFDGSGYSSAKAMLRGMPTLAGRLDALSMIAPVAYL